MTDDSPSADRDSRTDIATATGDRRPATEIVPLALLALIALLLFARPLIQREVLTLRDHSDYFQPMRLFTAEELRRGHLPLWNPYNASGEPWLANPQTGVFYPPAWLFLILPFATAYTLFLAAHVALLGCGAFLLFQRFASPAGAFLAALTLMLCGPSLSLLDVTNTLTTFAWIPLVLWCAMAMAPPAWCALAIAMSFLAGEPFFAALGALMFVALRRRDLLDVALTSFALSSIQLLPFLATLLGSDRAGNVAASEILRESIAPEEWIRLLVPPFIARGMPSQQFVPVVYVGMVGAVLALIAVVAARKRRVVQVATALVALAIVIAAGAHFRPVAYVLTHLPVTILRYPARMLPLGAMAIAALAAVGWDEVAGVVRYRWLAIVLAAVVIADLTPAIAPLMRSAPFDPHPTPYGVSVGRDAKLMRLTTSRPVDRPVWISGYMNLYDRRFDAWTAAPMVRERYARAYEHAFGRRHELDAMSIGYVLSDRPVAGLQSITHARGVGLYRNPHALPLAYWRGDDGRVLPVALLAVSASAVHVTVDAPADGTVVVTQQSERGWRATVDDVPARPADDGIFRAVRVKRGHHAIAWRYRPSSFFAGFFFTAIGFLRMLLSLLFVKHAR